MSFKEKEIKDRAIQGRGRNGYFRVRMVGVYVLEDEISVQMYSRRTDGEPPISLSGKIKDVVELLEFMAQAVKKAIAWDAKTTITGKTAEELDSHIKPEDVVNARLTTEGRL